MINELINDEMVRQAEVYLAQTGLARFTMYTYPDYICKWFHHYICDIIDSLLSGEYSKLMIFLPPQVGKSEIVSRRLPAYALGINPNLRIVACSYSHDLSSGFNRNVQRIIDSQLYCDLFSNTQLNSQNVSTFSKGNYLRNSNEFEIVGHSGGYKSVGIGGGLTGNPCDLGIIDDPIKDSVQAQSKIYRTRLWEWYNEVFLTRLHNDSKIILCQTRWHEDDLAGRLLNEEGGSWKVVSFPGIKEDNDNHDDKREIGEALWEEKHSQETYIEMKKRKPRTFASLIQQRPAPEEGNIFKREWFKYYTLIPPRFKRYLLSIDASFNDLKDSSKVAMTVWGELNQYLYLIGLLNGLWDFVKTLKMIEIALTQFPNIGPKLIENKANGAAIISVLKEKGIPGVIDINPKESKEARAYAVTPYFEAGNILFPEHSVAPWISTVESELLTFPNGKYNDIGDSITQCLRYVYLTNNSWFGKVAI